MKSIFKTLTVLLFAASAAPAFALNIFACEPEWAALVQELAGDRASLYTATTAQQDPHQVQARPSLIARARRAQLLVCTGAELEAGWLPVILQESANPDIAANRPGNFEAARFVSMLEVPARLDRADGDVHAAGNPHIQLDARIYLPVARALSQRLIELDPSSATYYAERLQSFTQRWQTALLRWEKQAAQLKGQPILVQHNAFAYLNHWLGLKQVAALEPKPGMEPSVSHLSQVLAQLQRQPAKMVLYPAYQDARPSKWMAEHAHIPAVALPFSVGGSEAAHDLFGLFDDTLEHLLAANK